MLRNTTLISMTVVLFLAVFAGCSDDGITSPNGSASAGSRNGVTICGYVTHSNGSLEYVEGADLDLYLNSGSSWVYQDSTTSDEDGYYEFTGLDTGYYKVECSYDCGSALHWEAKTCKCYSSGIYEIDFHFGH